MATNIAWPKDTQPAIAEQQVEPEQRHAIAEDGQQQRGAVFAEHEGRRRENRERQRGRAPSSPPRFTSRGFPNSPAGRRSSTATTTA